MLRKKEKEKKSVEFVINVKANASKLELGNRAQFGRKIVPKKEKWGWNELSKSYWWNIILAFTFNKRGQTRNN